MKPILSVLGIASIVACSQHSVSTSTATSGTTKAFLIDAPFPYDQVARVDVYIVSVAASSKPDTLGTGGPGTIATPHRTYNLLELANGSAAKLGEGLLLSGQYVQFFVTIDFDSSSITLKNGAVLTSRTSPGINWNGYPGRSSFGLFTDPPVQVTDTGAAVVIDFDLGRSFYANDPANAAAGFGYVGYMQVRNTAVTGSVSGTVTGANAGPIADASITLEIGTGVLGTARSDTAGRFLFPYESPGTYVLAVEAPAASAYGSLSVPNVTVSTGAETKTGTLVIPLK